MTRKSKREIERSIEDLGDDSHLSGPDLFRLYMGLADGAGVELERHGTSEQEVRREMRERHLGGRG